MSQDLPVDQRPDLIDNEIEASRAPLLDHLNELRSRLMKALIAFMVCAIGCFFIAGPCYTMNVNLEGDFRFHRPFGVAAPIKPFICERVGVMLRPFLYAPRCVLCAQA